MEAPVDIRRSVSWFAPLHLSHRAIFAFFCHRFSLFTPRDLYFGQRPAVETIKWILPTHTFTAGRVVKPHRERWCFPYRSRQGHTEQTLSCCVWTHLRAERGSCSIPAHFKIFLCEAPPLKKKTHPSSWERRDEATVLDILTVNEPPSMQSSSCLHKVKSRWLGVAIPHRVSANNIHLLELPQAPKLPAQTWTGPVQTYFT